MFLNCNSICNRAFDSWGDHSASSFDRSFNYLRETSLLASSSDKKFVFSFIDYSSDVNFVKIVKSSGFEMVSSTSKSHCCDQRSPTNGFEFED